MSKYSPLIVVTSVSSILFSNITLAQAPNIEGNWKMSIAGENITPTYTLSQKGNVLTGTFRSPIGNFPITGTINDNKVKFSAKSRGKSLTFAGTVSGETMSGVGDIPMKGRKNWTATKY
jgi:phage tail sheath gpL-like